MPLRLGRAWSVQGNYGSSARPNRIGLATTPPSRTSPSPDAISGRVVSYLVSIRVRINQKDAILRELPGCILQAFEANSIPLGTDPNTFLATTRRPHLPTCPATPHQSLITFHPVSFGATVFRRT